MTSANLDTRKPVIGQSRPLGDGYLQHARFTLLQDSQDIAALCESIGLNVDRVSGALVDIDNGDYVEVWVTCYRAPYAIDSVYECVIVDARNLKAYDLVINDGRLKTAASRDDV